jgi:hypothetical protein
MAEWQDVVREEAGKLGLPVTSGYRTPGEQAALHGSPTSYHTRGTRAYPGAIDIGGSADALTELFRRIRQAFQGRIEELYLNIPGGQSVAIKDNRYLGSNPEAGRPQHLHIAVGDTASPASRIPEANRGEAALRAAPAEVCVRQLCPPDFKGMIQGALGKQVEPQTNCLCWSDVWVYGAALSLIVGGSWMLFLSRGEKA